jgi:tRNA pseudouridine38-40 synthase
MKLRAKVAYDGTNFYGFQKQSNHRSVQEEIETALEKISGRPIAVIGAGRTDTGVHATGQVIGFELEWRHSLDALVRAMNVHLAEDVAVSEITECAERFHPRFSAISRTYEYTILMTKVRQPLRQRTAWQIEQELDVEKMNEGARALIGEHDFAAFGTAPSGREEESTVREVFRAEWRTARADELKFLIEANAFLYRMVRRIVLVLARVGQGQFSSNDVTEILKSKDANRIRGLAPACGLCLVDVKY